MGRKKAKTGTWATKKLLNSKAFWALTGTAKGILFQFLLARNMDNQHNCLNCKNLTMTYKRLEGLHGENPDGTPSGISRASVARGIRDLMAKGFIEIVRPGGTFKKDKAIYGLTDEWQWWTKGVVFIKKPRRKNAGRPTHEENLNPHNRNHTHPHKRNLKD